MIERFETTFQQLIDEGTLEIGDGYRARNDELGGSGPIFLRAGHVTDTHIDFEHTERFREDLRATVASKMCKPGDTVITTKGNSTGRTTFVAERHPPFVYSPHLSYWRSRNSEVLCGGFLRYWSRSQEFTRQLSGMKASTDMAPYLSLTDQRRLRITLPSISEQRGIARMLGALDEKIELNREMSTTLEAMARALFQSWFIDFDPVHPGAVEHVANLFSTELVDSPMGSVPRGWSVAALPEAIEVNPFRPLKKGSRSTYLDMKNLPTAGHCADEVVEREFGSGTKFRNGDTLVARITPCLENGKTGMVDFLKDSEVAWGSTEFIVLAPKPPLPAQFVYLLARSDAFRAHAIRNMTGTSGRQRVPAEALSNFLIAVPPPNVAQAFAELTTPMFEKIAANVAESRTLARMRDTLLPKLLSGELRVPADLADIT